MKLTEIFKRSREKNLDPEGDIKKLEEISKNDHRTMPYHIYAGSNAETVEQYAARFKKFHFNFKYRLAMPIIWLLQKWLKINYEGVPPAPHNTEIAAFNKVWHKSVTMMYTHCLRHVYNSDEKGTRSYTYWKTESWRNTGETMRTVGDTLTYAALGDTCTREFINLLMWNAWQEMNEIHKHDPALQHLLYTSRNVDEPSYFYLHRCLANKQMVLKSVGEKTCCELQKQANKEKKED